MVEMLKNIDLFEFTILLAFILGISILVESIGLLMQKITEKKKMNDERLIVTGLELPITDVKELHRIAQTCYTEGRKDGIAELEKIKDRIDDCITNCKKQSVRNGYERGIVIGMSGCIDIINEHISELKGDNNE